MFHVERYCPPWLPAACVRAPLSKQGRRLSRTPRGLFTRASNRGVRPQENAQHFREGSHGGVSNREVAVVPPAMAAGEPTLSQSAEKGPPGLGRLRTHQADPIPVLVASARQSHGSRAMRMQLQLNGGRPGSDANQHRPPRSQPESPRASPAVAVLYSRIGITT